jgi:hypothetical protein
MLNASNNNIGNCIVLNATSSTLYIIEGNSAAAGECAQNIISDLTTSYTQLKAIKNFGNVHHNTIGKIKNSYGGSFAGIEGAITVFTNSIGDISGNTSGSCAVYLVQSATGLVSENTFGKIECNGGTAIITTGKAEHNSIGDIYSWGELSGVINATTGIETNTIGIITTEENFGNILYSSGAEANINNNTIERIKTNNSGGIILSVAAANAIIEENNIGSIQLQNNTGATNLILMQGVQATTIVKNNHFNNIVGNGPSGTVKGIYLAASAINNTFGNIIINCESTIVLYGLESVTTATSNTFGDLRAYSAVSSATVYGIKGSTSATANKFNNIIGFGLGANEVYGIQSVTTTDSIIRSVMCGGNTNTTFGIDGKVVNNNKIGIVYSNAPYSTGYAYGIRLAASGSASTNAIGLVQSKAGQRSTSEACGIIFTNRTDWAQDNNIFVKGGTAARGLYCSVTTGTPTANLSSGNTMTAQTYGRDIGTGYAFDGIVNLVNSHVHLDYTSTTATYNNCFTNTSAALVAANGAIPTGFSSAGNNEMPEDILRYTL